LDGLGKIDEIIERAKELGAPAVGITDHASISCLAEFYKKAQEAGIKPIVGCEFYVVDDAKGGKGFKGEKRYHLTVWAKNWAGIQSIMEKLTLANTQFYKRPRLEFSQCFDFKDCMIGTACSSSILSRDDYLDVAGDFAMVYGDDFYLEIMPHVVNYGDGVDRMQVVNTRAVELEKSWGLKLVATNDAHYVRQEDAHTQEILLAIQTNKTWDDPKRWRFNGDALYMRSEREMTHAFCELPYLIPPEAVGVGLRNTEEIARKVNIELPEFKVELPSIHEDDDQAFLDAILEGWKDKIEGTKVDKVTYSNRLTYEMGVILELGFVQYFLIVRDIIQWAKSQGIMVGPARGSAAGSLVCYLLDITQVDPIKHGLFFERFLNPERIDLPDIDVDFQDNRRQEVFDYIRGKYGLDKTANINTFGKLTLKNAFRDVARVFGVNPLQINVLSKQVEDEESFENVPDLVKFAKKHTGVIDEAKKLQGTIRQQGVHACGLVVSSKPLQEVATIERRKDASVVNWDMRQCEDFGLLKIDVLGLNTLTVFDKTVELVKKNKGIDVVLTDIPLDDTETLEAFARGETIGVFQFENSGMQSLLKGLEAKTFETITDTTALFRPGSLNSGQTGTYVKVARGDEYESYVCDQLRPVLGPTKGVMVYQEQIMRIFSELAGFSWAQADKMRKIIGKKLGKDEFNKHRKRFVEGCAKRDIDESVANELFDKMVEFAAYSFNKSHAVAYTLISYWCMYLKVYHPLEFMTAYLSFSSGTESKVPIVVREAERLGIKVKRPDINISTDEFEIDPEDQNIVAPLGVIKGIGTKAVEAILTAREAGVFLSVEDFQERVNRRVVNKKVVGILMRAGAFEGFGVWEPDEEQRMKNYNELLSMFNKRPSLSLKAAPLDKSALTEVYREFAVCAKEHSRKTIFPAVSKAPAIMVINNPVKGEKEHFTNDGTKHFLKAIKALGFKQSDFYYTSPVKCPFSSVNAVSKECQARCFEALRKEILAVKPKLIVCFASNVLNIFSGDKPTMGKLRGELVYSKEFDAYVLFSYSPQYAFFNEDAQDKFISAMNILREVFTE
jgi:DNA polymerase-3 subunit alpha